MRKRTKLTDLEDTDLQLIACYAYIFLPPHKLMMLCKKLYFAFVEYPPLWGGLSWLEAVAKQRQSIERKSVKILKMNRKFGYPDFPKRFECLIISKWRLVLDDDINLNLSKPVLFEGFLTLKILFTKLKLPNPNRIRLYAYSDFFLREANILDDSPSSKNVLVNLWEDGEMAAIQMMLDFAEICDRILAIPAIFPTVYSDQVDVEIRLYSDDGKNQVFYEVFRSLYFEGSQCRVYKRSQNQQSELTVGSHSWETLKVVTPGKIFEWDKVVFFCHIFDSATKQFLGGLSGYADMLDKKTRSLDFSVEKEYTVNIATSTWSVQLDLLFKESQVMVDEIVLLKIN
jgi:hypothetical protein